MLGPIVNSNWSTWIFIFGVLIFTPSLYVIIRISEIVGGLVGFNVLTGHWWLLFLTGLTFCVIGFSHDRKPENKLNEKLARMSKDLISLKLIVSGLNNTSTKNSQPHKLLTPEPNSRPEKDAVGKLDSDGFEWVNSGDGKNWYRTQGSSEDWVEFSN